LEGKILSGFKIGAWLFISAIVTWGLYMKVYSSIKDFQKDVKNPKLKFLIFLVLVWILIAVVVSINERAVQNVVMFIGLVVTLSVYSVFFVLKKFND
jgi:hypothetical protein